MIFIFLCVINAVYSLTSPSLSLHPDVYLTTQEMALAHGFRAENYTVHTPDGYMLTLFRIRASRQQTARRPVILQHGFLDCSDGYLINENPALAYDLASKGFDVWLPNFRGNRYSRRHESLNPDRDTLFWDFSMDELIAKDVPSILRFVVNATGGQQVHYVGHSMGAGTLVAAASEAPEFFAAHLRSFVALSAATSLANSAFLMHLAKQFPIQLLFSTSVGELYVGNSLRDIAVKLCHAMPSVCAAGMDIVLGKGELVNRRKLEVLMSHAPNGTSTTVLRHLLQQSDRPGFFHYRRPLFADPKVEYDLTRYPSDKVSTLIIGSKGDRIVSHLDSRWLRDKVSSKGRVKYIEYEDLGHFTYQLLENDDIGFFTEVTNFLLMHD